MNGLRKAYIAKLALLPWTIVAASYTSNAFAVTTQVAAPAGTCALSEEVFNKIVLGSASSTAVAMSGCNTKPVTLASTSSMTKTDFAVVAAGGELTGYQLRYWNDPKKGRLWLVVNSNGKVVGKHYKRHDLSVSYCMPKIESGYQVLADGRKGSEMTAEYLQRMIGCSGRKLYKSEFLTTQYNTKITTYIWGNLSLKDRALMVRTAIRTDLKGYPAGPSKQPYVVAIKDVNPVSASTACTPINAVARKIVDITDISQLKSALGCAPLLASDYLGDISSRGAVVPVTYPTLVYGSQDNQVLTINMSGYGFNSQYAPLPVASEIGCSSLTGIVFSGIKSHIEGNKVYENNAFMKPLVAKCADVYFQGSELVYGKPAIEFTTIGGSKSGWKFTTQHTNGKNNLGQLTKYYVATKFENLKTGNSTCRPGRENFSVSAGAKPTYSEVIKKAGCQGILAEFFQSHYDRDEIRGYNLMMWHGYNGDYIPVKFNFADWSGDEGFWGVWNFLKLYSDADLKKDYPNVYDLWVK